jgi:mono/diheme cytochrome c family protein
MTMRPGRRFAVALAACVVLAVAGGVALAWRPAIAPAPTPPTGFAPDAVARGARVAALGDCVVCHTAQGGQPYAGGRPLPTPFGTIYATNITPDPETGIGRWTQLAFRRAMRDGIARDGTHLYPALPYTHFTRATDADLSDLYAFVMTRAPVDASSPPDRLPFPLNVRAVMAGWNLLFLRPGPWQPDPAHDAEWNRGAYLVEAVGHCGACHTPRNALGAERGGDALAGGDAEGWLAPALGDASPARHPWTMPELTAYLRDGIAAQHGVAGGPMGPVTQHLAQLPEADIRAIATYLLSRLPPDQPAPAPPPATVADNAVFAGACGSCHAADAPMMRAGAPSLALSSAVNAPTSLNVVETILHGIPMREGVPGPFMPGFAAALTDAQVAELAGYVRARYSDKPAWTDIDAQISRARQMAAQQEAGG